VAEHCIGTRHKIGFGETTVLATSAGYMDILEKEAIEIQLHPNNFSRDRRFMLSQAWHLLINVFHKAKQHSDLTCAKRTQNRNWRGARLISTETRQRPEGCTTLAEDGSFY
jgi:hypothetical protein